MRRTRLPDRQSALAREALARPVRWSLFCGVLLAVSVLVIVGDWRGAVAAGVVTSLLMYWLWSPRGWLRRREERLYDADGNRHITIADDACGDA